MAKNKINPNDVREGDEFVNNLRREKKELILAAERVALKTIRFDFDIELPYKALAAALKRLTSDKITDLTQMAWRLMEKWLKTSLCLQYKPRYIAVGSVIVAARVLNVKLRAGEKWLKELGVLPVPLDEIVCWMQSKICKVETKEVVRVVSFSEITSRPLQKG